MLWQSHVTRTLRKNMIFVKLYHYPFLDWFDNASKRRITSDQKVYGESQRSLVGRFDLLVVASDPSFDNHVWKE